MYLKLSNRLSKKTTLFLALLTAATTAGEPVIHRKSELFSNIHPSTVNSLWLCGINYSRCWDKFC